MCILHKGCIFCLFIKQLSFMFCYYIIFFHFFTFAGFAVSQGADQMVYTEMTENKSDFPKRMFPVPKLFYRAKLKGWTLLK